MTKKCQEIQNPKAKSCPPNQLDPPTFDFYQMKTCFYASKGTSVQQSNIVVGDKNKIPVTSIKERRRPFLAKIDREKRKSEENNGQNRSLSRLEARQCINTTPGKRKFSFDDRENCKKHRVGNRTVVKKQPD